MQLLDKLETAQGTAQGMAQIATLEEVECSHIVQTLMENWWRIHRPQGAALLLGLTPSTLRFRMKKLGSKEAWNLNERPQNFSSVD